MRNSKLVALLSLFSEAERKQFARFLASPYHNRNSALYDLFQVMDKELLRYKLRDLSEEKAWERLFPKQAFDKNKFRKLCTALLGLGLEFLKIEAFRNAPMEGQMRLIERLNLLEADRFLARSFENLERNLRDPGEREGRDWQLATNHELAFRLALERYRHAIRQPGRRPSTLPVKAMRELELSYRIRKMQLLYLQLNEKRITGAGGAMQEERFLEKVKENLDDLPPLTKMYFHLYRCTKDLSSQTDFEALRDLLGAWDGKIPRDQISDIYTGAVNYCARRLNKGDTNWLLRIFGLYKEMIEREVLLESGKLLSAHFKNVLTVAARAGEFEWARGFIRTYSEDLIDDYENNALHFGQGVVEYFEGNGAAAEKHFNIVLNAFEDLFFGLDARLYLLRTHFESGNTVGLESLCDSFRMFLKRNKELPKERKTNYLDFIRYIRRLGRIPAFERKKLEQLREEIVRGRRMATTAWLLAKVDELLGSP